MSDENIDGDKRRPNLVELLIELLNMEPWELHVYDNRRQRARLTR